MDNVQILLETQNLTPNKVKFTLLAATQKFPYGSQNAFEPCSRENVVGPMSATASLVECTSGDMVAHVGNVLLMVRLTTLKQQQTAF